MATTSDSCTDLVDTKSLIVENFVAVVVVVDDDDDAKLTKRKYIINNLCFDQRH